LRDFPEDGVRVDEYKDNPFPPSMIPFYLEFTKKQGLFRPSLLRFCGSLFSEKAGLWLGCEGVVRKKHRPSYFGFRISDFFDFLFQSAFRNRHSAIWWRAHRALPNSEFGMWNSEFSLLFFHSASRNRHSAFKLPGHSKKRGAPHGFCAQRPCFRAGQCLKFNQSDAKLAKGEGGQALAVRAQVVKGGGDSGLER